VCKPIFGSNDPNSPLQPRGDEINARVDHEYRQFADERGWSFRYIGLRFQDLNASDYGTLADFQKDACKVWLALSGIPRRLFPSTIRQTRTEILHYLTKSSAPARCTLSLTRLVPVVRPSQDHFRRNKRHSRQRGLLLLPGQIVQGDTYCASR
jgi:hypothetical protein